MQIGVDSQRAVENRRIFVLEPDEINSMGLQFMLADDNETHVLASLSAAQDKSLNWPPDLILLGSAYLSGDGAAVVRKIRVMMSQAKILIVCTDPNQPGVREALDAGASGLVSTPLTIEGVRRRVDMALGRIAPLGIPVVRV